MRWASKGGGWCHVVVARQQKDGPARMHSGQSRPRQLKEVGAYLDLPEGIAPAVANGVELKVRRWC